MSNFLLRIKRELNDRRPPEYRDRLTVYRRDLDELVKQFEYLDKIARASYENSQPHVEPLLHKHGVCRNCGEMYGHHIDEPFASCKCGTSEWSGRLTPYMDLEIKLWQAESEAKRLKLILEDLKPKPPKIDVVI